MKKGSVASVADQDAILLTHGIEPQMMREDDFDAFYLARRTALLRMIEGAMGKAAYQGEAAEPVHAQNDSTEEAIDEDDMVMEDEAALPAGST